MQLTTMIFTILIWIWLVGCGNTLGKFVRNQETIIRKLEEHES